MVINGIFVDLVFGNDKGFVVLCLTFVVQYALPHILGWDKLTNKLPAGSVGGKVDASKVDRRDLDAEWDK